MTETFDQNRKEKAATVESTAKRLLASFFDVPQQRIISAESQISERYNTDELTPVKLLDFACVDWMVDTRPAIETVAQRITPVSGRGRMSIRTNNGTNMPCEHDVLSTNGLKPNYYFFGHRKNNQLTRAWILDVDKTYNTMKNHQQTEFISNEDGTAAMYLSIADLARAGCVETGYNI